MLKDILKAEACVFVGGGFAGLVVVAGVSDKKFLLRHLEDKPQIFKGVAEFAVGTDAPNVSRLYREVRARSLADMNQQVGLLARIENALLHAEQRKENLIFAGVVGGMVAKDVSVILFAKGLDSRREGFAPRSVGADQNRDAVAYGFGRREFILREEPLNNREFGQLLDAEIAAEARFKIDVNRTAAVAG